MLDQPWNRHVGELQRLLTGLSCRRHNAEECDPEDGFARWKHATLRLRDRGRTLYLIGNGASASMASHMSADLAKNGHIHTEVFSDLSLITAISNDLGYECVFSEPLSRRARAGDMLVAISSSGRSRNVLLAVDEALRHRVMVVTLSAMAAANPLRRRGALNFYVPATTYGGAETCHAAILHHWMDSVSVVE